jgi:hypothetical protein
MSDSRYLLFQSLAIVEHAHRIGSIGADVTVDGDEVAKLFHEITSSEDVATDMMANATDRPVTNEDEPLDFEEAPLDFSAKRHSEAPILHLPLKRLRANSVVENDAAATQRPSVIFINPNARKVQSMAATSVSAVSEQVEIKSFRQKLSEALFRYLNARPVKIEHGYSLEISGFQYQDQPPPDWRKKCIHMAYSQEHPGDVVTMRVDKFDGIEEKPSESIVREYRIGKELSEGGKSYELLVYAGIAAARKMASTSKRARKKADYNDSEVRNRIGRIFFDPKIEGLELGRQTYALMGKVITNEERRNARQIYPVRLFGHRSDDAPAVSPNRSLIPQQQ